MFVLQHEHYKTHMEAVQNIFVYVGSMSHTAWVRRHLSYCGGDQSACGADRIPGTRRRPEVPRCLVLERKRTLPSILETSCVNRWVERNRVWRCERWGHRGSADPRGRALWPSQYVGRMEPLGPTRAVAILKPARTLKTLMYDLKCNGPVQQERVVRAIEVSPRSCAGLREFCP